MAHVPPRAPRTVDPIDATTLLAESFDHDQVTGLRHRVAGHARALGLTGQRLDDFVLAVNELTTNAVRHGGGRGWLRLWSAGRTVLCEVSDHGAGLTPERANDRRHPASDIVGGWGLWLARQLSDGMTVRSGPAGTTVRIASVAQAPVDGAPAPPDAPR